MSIKGKVQLLSEYRGKYYLLDLKVVDINTQALLGLNACKELNLVQCIMAVNKRGQESNSSKQSQAGQVVEEYDDVFDDLGNLVKHHIVIGKAVPPVVQTPCKVPFGLQAKLQKTLRQLQRTGVIAKVDGPTDSGNSLAIAVKINGKLRLCLDPRDFNMTIKQGHYPVPTAKIQHGVFYSGK